MNDNSRLKKTLLYSLVASVLFGTLLAIFLVVRNTWGWLEIRVILTTAIIAVASLCGLACELSKTHAGSNLLPKSGLVLTFISAAMFLFAVWSEIESEAFWKATASITVFAVATVHVCLLSIAKLVARFRWVYFVGCQIIFGVAALTCAIIIGEISSEAVWRLLVTLSIVVAAITVVIPILHRIGRMEANRGDLLMPIDDRNVASIDDEIERLQHQIALLQRRRNEITGENG